MSLPTIRHFDIMAQTLSDQHKWADMVSKTDFAPVAYKGRPDAILVAVHYGAELGLKPLQSLGSIAVIRGKPCLYGDGLLAVCRSCEDWEWMAEGFDDENWVAICTVKRKGEPEAIISFGKEDAVKAKLWGKAGPWTDYPKRMLAMRARGFALRNTYADMLCGLISADEAQDYQYTGKTEESIPMAAIGEGESRSINCELIAYIAEKGMTFEETEKLLGYYSEKLGRPIKNVLEFSDEEARRVMAALRKKYEDN